MSHRKTIQSWASLARSLRRQRQRAWRFSNPSAPSTPLGLEFDGKLVYLRRSGGDREVIATLTAGMRTLLRTMCEVAEAGFIGTRTTEWLAEHVGAARCTVYRWIQRLGSRGLLRRARHHISGRLETGWLLQVAFVGVRHV